MMFFFVCLMSLCDQPHVNSSAFLLKYNLQKIERIFCGQIRQGIYVKATVQQ